MASLSGSMRSNSIAYLDVLWEAAVGILLKVVLGEEGKKEGWKEGRKKGWRERHKEGGGRKEGS